MPKVGILGCEATTREMDCVMIGCFGNLRGRQGMFEQYSEDDPPELVGIISCGGCPTAFGTDRVETAAAACANVILFTTTISHSFVDTMAARRRLFTHGRIIILNIMDASQQKMMLICRRCCCYQTFVAFHDEISFEL